MKNLFTEQDLLVFAERFKTDLKCKEYLANFKWEKGFICVKCKHTTGQIHKDFSRTCSICAHKETAAANTLFDEVKFGLGNAFLIFFEMSTTTKILPASDMGVRFGISEKRARLFINKVRESIKANEIHSIKGIKDVDEVVYWWEGKR